MTLHMIGGVLALTVCGVCVAWAAGGQRGARVAVRGVVLRGGYNAPRRNERAHISLRRVSS